MCMQSRQPLNMSTHDPLTANIHAMFCSKDTSHRYQAEEGMVASLQKINWKAVNIHRYGKLTEELSHSIADALKSGIYVNDDILNLLNDMLYRSALECAPPRRKHPQNRKT